MRRRALLAGLPVALLGVAATAAVAAPKPKGFTRTYTASAPVPGVDQACAGGVPMARHVEPVKVPAAGTLVVQLGGFLGDWDLRLQQGTAPVAESQGIQPLDGDVETISVAVKKAGAFAVVACNYYGGPTGTVTLTYRP